MSQKLLFVFLFLSISITCSAQLCPDCVYEIIFNDNPQFWEDPDGIIYGSDDILSPNKNGTWTFFEIDEQLSRIDLFTRDVYCADGSIIRSSKPKSQELRVFPNPAKGKLMIESPYEDFSLMIYAINGSQIMSKAYQGIKEETINLNTTDLNPGIYILRIFNQDDQINHLFIVQ